MWRNQRDVDAQARVYRHFLRWKKKKAFDWHKHLLLWQLFQLHDCRLCSYFTPVQKTCSIPFFPANKTLFFHKPSLHGTTSQQKHQSKTTWQPCSCSAISVLQQISAATLPLIWEQLSHLALHACVNAWIRPGVRALLLSEGPCCVGSFLLTVALETQAAGGPALPPYLCPSPD